MDKSVFVAADAVSLFYHRHRRMNTTHKQSIPKSLGATWKPNVTRNLARSGLYWHGSALECILLTHPIQFNSTQLKFFLFN